LPSACAHTEDACWVLLGPTASGKTEVSLELAQRHPVEIVSVDSMQVYRGMDIGTAKPTPEQMERVPHHMIDVVEPEERFNAARFRRMALEALEGVRQRGRRPLLLCGTPFYLKALLWGLFEGPGADEEIRARLRQEAEEHGSAHLHRRLAQVDPESAERIDPNDMKRIERALEVYELTGRPISERQDQFEGAPQISHVSVGLKREREELYERICRRVERMMEEGLVEEVRSLRGRLGPQAGQAVGYKEIVSYLEDEISLEEATRLIKRNTRHLAKSQISWFGRFPIHRWIEISGGGCAAEIAERCENAFLQAMADNPCTPRCI
jgi:tRNA dimethylallyltransferase